MEKNPKLLEADLVNTEGRLEIRREPEDRRKACLEHLMLEAERGNAEARAVFRDIGRHLGRIGREIDWLLSPKTQERYLYGRFVKPAACFALMQGMTPSTSSETVSRFSPSFSKCGLDIWSR